MGQSKGERERVLGLRVIMCVLDICVYSLYIVHSYKYICYMLSIICLINKMWRLITSIIVLVLYRSNCTHSYWTANHNVKNTSSDWSGFRPIYYILHQSCIMLYNIIVYITICTRNM